MHACIQVNPLQMLIIVVVNVSAYVGNKFLCVDYRGGVDNTGCPKPCAFLLLRFRFAV